MVSIVTALVYILLGAIASVFAFLLFRAVVKALARFIYFLPEYLWHNVTVLLVAAFFVVLIMLMIGLT